MSNDPVKRKPRPPKPTQVELRLMPAPKVVPCAGADDPRPEGGMSGILAQTAKDHDLPICALESRCRRRRVAWARQDFMWRCRQVFWPDGSHRYSFPMIGAFLDMDHTTIIHGDREHAKRLAALAEAA